MIYVRRDHQNEYAILVSFNGNYMFTVYDDSPPIIILTVISSFIKILIF